MNQELIFIIKCLVTHRTQYNGKLCHEVHDKFANLNDICTNWRCRVCPLGVSHVSAKYLRPLIIKVIK